jgi:hypothetical protein
MVGDAGGRAPEDIVGHEEVFAAVNFPTVRAIEKQSRSNGFVTVLAILQVLWFGIQCIARRASNIAITELELSTSAFIILTIVTHIAWWSKPAELQMETVVTDSATVTRITELANTKGLSIGRLPHRRPNYYTADDAWEEYVLDPSSKAGQWSEPAAREHRKDGQFTFDFPTFFGSITTSVVGGIHLLAWNFPFPTPWERILWRVTSLVITTLPVTGFLIELLAELVQSILRRDLPLADYDVDVLFLCRVILIVQTFACLRAQPASVYEVVQWTEFFPHI